MTNKRVYVIHILKLSTTSNVDVSTAINHFIPTHYNTMGWFSSSKKEEDNAAPTRQDRQKCWETRDAYFACLDRVGVVKAGEEGSACSKEQKEYAKNCAQSWVRRGTPSLKAFRLKYAY